MRFTHPNTPVSYNCEYRMRTALPSAAYMSGKSHRTWPCSHRASSKSTRLLYAAYSRGQQAQLATSFQDLHIPQASHRLSRLSSVPHPAQMTKHVLKADLHTMQLQGGGGAEICNVRSTVLHECSPPLPQKAYKFQFNSTKSDYSVVLHTSLTVHSSQPLMGPE